MIKQKLYKTSYWNLLLVVAVIIVNPAYGQKLKGKVKSYRDSYYTVHEKFGVLRKDEKLDDEIIHDQFVTFDQNGNVIRLVEYNADGTIECTYNGRTDYEDNNIETTYIRFYQNTAFEKMPFVLESVVSSLGRSSDMTYNNDSLGRPVEEIIYDHMGRELHRILYKRDDRGNLIGENFSEGTVNEYKYDYKGNRIVWVSRSSGGNTTVTSYKYDKFGNVIEMYVDNFFKSTYKFHYDRNTYIYRYDRQDNWIERIDFENDIPLRVVERKIEYQREPSGK